ncbi:two-component response regulator (plasmid) [Azospirillum sp. B510]|uniref:response regulator n=1 Tax=Azospirillum sp. (strain B510) TaxID=137722 RepID=UPI0001C4BD04|nr:response regulator [Azospirillum sp. B510]BAI73573.1 two-component response regulator [Azospirillum sp. B510]
MPDYDFSQVDAAIIDGQANAGRVFRDVLIRLGFRRVELFDQVKAAAGLLTAAMPDLVLVDADGEPAEAFQFIRALRNEPSVPNPFAGIIVTTWTPTPALLTRVTNVGGDDLLLKPASPKQVRDRVVSLIESRKGFVVTADYTGPDRRKSPREGALVPVLDAPNTLRLKATGQWTQSGARLLLNDAIAAVTTQKRLRAGIQVAFLVEFALPGLARPAPDRMSIDHVGRIGGFVDDLLRRLDQEGDHAPIEAVAHALKALAGTVRAAAESGPVSADDRDQLQSLSRALMRAVDPDRPLEAMVREVSSAVAGYRSRLEQIAQAKAAGAAGNGTDNTGAPSAPPAAAGPAPATLPAG